MSDEVKIVLVGDTGVGKTSVSLRLIHNMFQDQSPSTLSASFLRKTISGVPIQIWDTAGQEKFRTMAPLYYRNAYAIVLVFDVTRQVSFESLKFWVDDIKAKFAALTPPKLIVAGNKIDLDDQREVKNEDVIAFVEQHNAEYHSVSAATGENVHLLFQQVVEAFKQERSTEPRKKKMVITDERTKGGCC